MTLLQSLILGIIQGLTEFLPVSSSAHLVLIPHLLGWQIPESQVFPFDVLVQLGTLVAVILYFWKDLWEIVRAFFKALIERKPFETKSARLGWYLILATIPAGVAGILIKDQVEAAFNSPTATALFLFVTAALLVVAELVGKRTRELTEIKWLDALWIGIFQAISLFPGISRSGSTITGGMTRNFNRPAAARFSFLMSVPVMLGAGLVSIKDALEVPGFGDFLPILLVGFISALLVGYLSIHWLLSFLGKRPLYIFAIYCVLFASIVLGNGLIKNNSAIGAPSTLSASQATAPAVKTQAPAEIMTSIPGEGPLTVAYTSSVNWLLPAMNVCADTVTGMAVVTHETLPNPVEPNTDQLFFQWGAPETLANPAYELGSEQLAIIVHNGNDLTSISPDLVQKIFSSQISTWSDFYAICPDCFSAAPEESFLKHPVDLVVYSYRSEPQIIFETAFLKGKILPYSSANIVPDSEAMLAEVANDVFSIGFIGSRFISNGVKWLTISGDFDPSQGSAPIIAISNNELSASTKSWLACLQEILTP